MNFEQYIYDIKLWYKNAKGLGLDLKNPKTYGEKQQWLKIYDSTPLKTRLADKFLVREWVREKIGDEYLIPIYGVWDNFDDIDFDKLPNRFVLKCNHGSGYNIVVTNKAKLNIEEARNKINFWMSQDYAMNAYEMHYSAIKRKIIAEKYIEPEKSSFEINSWCFNGELKFISYETARHTKDLYRCLFDINWNKLNFKLNPKIFKEFKETPKKIECFEEYKRLVSILAKDFLHVRVDFILYENKLYFREMTFTPGAGLNVFEPEEAGYMVGNMLKLPINPPEKYKMKEESLNICFITDKHYAKYTAVTMYSIIKNTDKNIKINFYVMHTGLNYRLRNKFIKLKKQNNNVNLIFINLKEQNLKVNNLPEKAEHITKTSYYKFFIADILKNVDKVLYMDGDIIVDNQIEELFDTDISDVLLGAVEDVGYTYWRNFDKNLTLKHKCINSGVMLINCKKWREENLSKKLLETAQEGNKLGTGQDQPVFNVVCKDKIKFLDFKYNVQDPFLRKGEEVINREDYKIAYVEKDFPTVMHWTFIGKPWKNVNLFEADIWWKYFRESKVADVQDIIYFKYKKIYMPLIVSIKNRIKACIRRWKVIYLIIRMQEE